MEHNGTRCTALFDIAKDPMLKRNLVPGKNQEREKLELFIRAYIQQYNNRLIENRMMVDN
jgi:hypothetical protein